jgi:hypothetical protein
MPTQRSAFTPCDIDAGRHRIVPGTIGKSAGGFAENQFPGKLVLPISCSADDPNTVPGWSGCGIGTGRFDSSSVASELGPHN